MAFNKFQGFTLLISFLVICLLNMQAFDFAEEGAFEDVVEQMVNESGEVDSELVEKVTKKHVKMLPSHPMFKNPVVMGAVVSIITALVAVAKFYFMGEPADWPKHMTDQLEKAMKREVSKTLNEFDQGKVKNIKQEIKEKVQNLVAEGDVKGCLGKVVEFAEIVQAAQKKFRVKCGDFNKVINDMKSYKEIEVDESKNYIAPLQEEVEKASGGVMAVTADDINIPGLYKDKWLNLVHSYITTLHNRRDARLWLEILNKSDKDLLTVDTSKTPQEILNKK